jgi:hypothetical protein
METTHFYRVGEGDPLASFRRRQRERLAAEGARVGAPLGEAFHLLVDGL